jgi:hypothetical protein
MLRQIKLYLKCFGIAVLCGIHGIVLDHLHKGNGTASMGAMLPLVLLVLQKPLRYIYLNLFKTEPKVENFGKFSDLLYMLILFMGTIVLTALIFGKIK